MSLSTLSSPQLIGAAREISFFGWASTGTTATPITWPSTRPPKAGDDLASRLKRLLDQWIAQLHGLRKDGGAAFLPYDFSDQCTGWLRVCSAEGDRVTVQAGWSLVEGWRLELANYAVTVPEVTDYEPITNARIECSLDDLIRTVERNRDAFRPI